MVDVGEGVVSWVIRLSLMACRVEIVGAPKREAVYQHHAAADVVTAELALLFYVGPAGTAAFLMAADALAELLVPYMGGGHVNRGGGELQRQTLGIGTFSRALPSGNEDDFAHKGLVFMETLVIPVVLVILVILEVLVI
jgi:hypothetical protein